MPSLAAIFVASPGSGQRMRRQTATLVPAARDNITVYRSPSTSVIVVESVDCYWPLERCILHHDPKTSAKTSRRDQVGRLNNVQEHLHAYIPFPPS